MGWIRWLFILPAGSIASAIFAYPIQWLITLATANVHGLSAAQHHAIDTMPLALISPIFYLLGAAAMAPNHQLTTAKIISFLSTVLGIAVTFFAVKFIPPEYLKRVGTSEWEQMPIYLGLSIIGSLLGLWAVSSLYKTKRRSPRRRAVRRTARASR